MSTLNANFNESALDVLREFRDGTPLFAEKCLKIIDKQKRSVPLIFNAAQLRFHQKLEEQKARQGFVRAIILKARQMGISTYVEARGSQKAVFVPNSAIKIMAHQRKASEAIFSMLKYYLENLPFELPLKTANVRELIIDKMNSRVSVATAEGTPERGDTTTFLHGSEVGFWAKAEEHIAALFQQVPTGTDAVGTEIILESTANGIGNYFHKKYKSVEAAKEDEWICHFEPWFAMESYSSLLPARFDKTLEEIKYQSLLNLSDSQIYWRRLKIQELGDPLLFQQEYPATAQEAFITSGNSFISAHDITRARRNTQALDNFPYNIGGLDLAFSSGGDRTVLCNRRGQRIMCYEKWPRTDDQQAIVGMIVDAFKKHNLLVLFVDAGAGGRQIAAWVRSLHPDLAPFIIPIDFGASSPEQGFYNMRALMLHRCNEWFKGDVRAPDSDEMQGDLQAYERKLSTTHTQLQVNSKPDIIKSLGRSPDVGDSTLLTFAMPIDRFVSMRTQQNHIHDLRQEQEQHWSTSRHGY